MKTNGIFIGIFIGLQTVNGQSLSGLIKEAETLFEKTRTHLVFPRNEGFLPHKHFYTTLDTIKNVSFWEQEVKKLESDQYYKDIGLVFKANANYNLRNGFDEETNNFNIGTVRAELEWNILKTGYTQNRIRSQILENDIKILQFKSLQSERILKRRQFRIDYTYAINREGIEFFKKFLAFENEYFDYLNKLYFKKYLKREQLIKVSHQINILKNQITALEKHNEMIKDSVSEKFLSVGKLPFLRLNMDSLDIPYNQRKLELEKENIELEHKAKNDLNFSLYVQENLNYMTNGHRFFPSVGLRFRAPIRFNHRKKIIAAKQKIVTAREIDKSVGKYNRFITLVSGYNEKLKDIQNQYKNWEFIEERIRVLSVLKTALNNEETGTLLLGLMEEEFKVLENMLQLKRQLYTSLAHVFEITELDLMYNFIVPIEFKEFASQKFFAIRHSNYYSIDFQIEFLRAKGCKEVQVLGKDFEIQKALYKANIKFKKVEKITYQLAESLIQKELMQIQPEP